jgi:hypothetical protein
MGRQKKRIETILHPKIIYYRIQKEMKKMNAQFWTQTKQI